VLNGIKLIEIKDSSLAGLENKLLLLWRIQFLVLNPFISFTPSKPLMSLGSWLTLHNWEIYHLSAVNGNLVTAESIYNRGGVWGLQYISQPTYFSAEFPYHISRGQYLPGGGGRGFTANFSTHCFLRVTIYLAALPPNISAGHNCPPTFTALYWLVSRSLFTIGP
jgi:hypothetical protein